MSVRGGPAQARLVRNSLLTKPLPSGAQVVIGKKRARERESSFLFPPSLPAPAMRVTKRTGDDSATWLHNNSLCTDALPPLPSEKIGEGHLYTGYTITILYNVFRCGLMYHSIPNL